MKTPDDFSNRKEDRRQKLKHKTKKGHYPQEEDTDLPQSKIKHEIKKMKQDFEDEEWEDWDRYYNH